MMNPRYYGGLGAKVLNPGEITDTADEANASRALAQAYGYWNEAPMLQEAAFWGSPLSSTQQTLEGMQRRDLDYQRMYEETLRENLRNALQARQMGQNRDLKQQELQQNAWAKQGDWGLASDKIRAETEASKNKLQSDLTKWVMGEQKADQRAKLQTDATKYGADKRAESSWIQNLMNMNKADEANNIRQQGIMAQLFGHVKLPPDSDITRERWIQAKQQEAQKLGDNPTRTELEQMYNQDRINRELQLRQSTMRGMFPGFSGVSVPQAQTPQAGAGQAPQATQNQQNIPGWRDANSLPVNPDTWGYDPNKSRAPGNYPGDKSNASARGIKYMSPEELRQKWWFLSLRNPLKPVDLLGQWLRGPRNAEIELQ